MVKSWVDRSNGDTGLRWTRKTEITPTKRKPAGEVSDFELYCVQNSTDVGSWGGWVKGNLLMWRLEEGKN